MFIRVSLKMQIQVGLPPAIEKTSPPGQWLTSPSPGVTTRGGKKKVCTLRLQFMSGHEAWLHPKQSLCLINFNSQDAHQSLIWSISEIVWKSCKWNMHLSFTQLSGPVSKNFISFNDRAKHVSHSVSCYMRDPDQTVSVTACFRGYFIVFNGLQHWPLGGCVCWSVLWGQGVFTLGHAPFKKWTNHSLTILLCYSNFIPQMLSAVLLPSSHAQQNKWINKHETCDFPPTTSDLHSAAFISFWRAWMIVCYFLCVCFFLFICLDIV